MNKIFAPFLPPWVETGLQPAFYDMESGTVLQQTARVYAKVQQLTRLFNELSEETKNEIETFETNVDNRVTEFETNVDNRVTEFETNVDNRVTEFENSVNATVQDYIDKFVALKDFVDDYFDNLDVQEEINNKLDAMVEDGTLQEIITTYIQSNVTWTFDTVAEMQTGTNFVNGSYARTLGYYSINDGGAGTYKIRTKTESDTPDGGSLISLSDTLVAELTYTNKVNVKQFGAYGDGTHDDTIAIQNAINFVKSIILSNDDIVVDEPIVSFAGRFKITNTIHMPPYIKYEMVGNVLILADLQSGVSALHFDYETPTPTVPSNYYYAQQWLHGKLFYGGALRLLSLNDYVGNAIELGNSTNPSTVEKAICRTIINDISIQKFDTAILCNMYNFYIVEFNNIKMHHNNYHVKFGASVYTNVNSGENLSFVSCLFGTSTYHAIENNISSLNVLFDRCSFDFCGDGIMKINRNINITVDNSHIEGIRTSNATGYFYIPSDSSTDGVVLKLTNTRIYLYATDEYAKVAPLAYCGNKALLSVILDKVLHNLSDNTISGAADANNQYMINGSSTATIRVNATDVKHNFMQVAKDCDLNIEGDFNDISDESVVTTDGYYSISGNTNYKGGANAIVKIVNGKKYLRIQPVDEPVSQNGNFLLRLIKKVPVKPNRIYGASMIIRVGDLVDANTGFPTFRFNIYLNFYDGEGKQIGTQQYYQGQAGSYAIDTTNKDYKNKRNVLCTVPNDKRIEYAEIKYQYESSTKLSNLTYVYLGGLSFEESEDV